MAALSQVTPLDVIIEKATVKTFSSLELTGNCFDAQVVDSVVSIYDASPFYLPFWHGSYWLQDLQPRAYAS